MKIWFVLLTTILSLQLFAADAVVKAAPAAAAPAPAKASPAVVTTNAATAKIAAAKKRAALPAFQEGNQYTVINPIGKTAQPTVVEVFSYGCPHCFQFEEFIHSWLPGKPDAVQYVRMPAVGMRDEWDLFAKAFYVAEALGMVEKTHQAFFNLIHVDNKPPRNEDDVIAFYVRFGADEKVVRETINGFYVDSKMRSAKEYMRKYKLPGVPSFVVNDKYLIDNKKTGTFEMFDKILSELPLQK